MDLAAVQSGSSILKICIVPTDVYRFGMAKFIYIYTRYFMPKLRLSFMNNFAFKRSLQLCKYLLREKVNNLITDIMILFKLKRVTLV